MPSPPVDVRLAPAAALCWGACLGAVRLSPPLCLALAVAALAVALVVALVDTLGAGRRDRPGRGTGHVVLGLVVLGAALASAGSQRAVRDAGLLGALAAEGVQVRVEGTVSGEPVPVRAGPSWADPDRVRLELRVDRVTGRGRSGPAAARVLVIAGETWRPVAYGSRVEALGTVVGTSAGDRARAVLVVRGPPVVRGAPGAVDARVGRVRQALLRVTDGLPADRRGLVPGAAIGDTSRVPADLDEAMRASGLTHITAVSGAHFAIVGGVVLVATAALGVPRVARAAVVAVAMAGFVLLVHPTPSVLRAAAMGAVGVAALVLGRPSRAVPALAAAVVVLLVLDPWLAGSIGFGLSVVATAGIVLGVGPLARALGPVVPERAARLVAVPLAAQLACGPVVAGLGSGLATYAVPANLLAAPAVAPATVLGVLAALVAPWWHAGGVACAEAAGWATAWIAAVARTAAGLPGSQVPWPAAPAGPLLLAGLTVAALLTVTRPWRPVVPR